MFDRKGALEKLGGPGPWIYTVSALIGSAFNLWSFNSVDTNPTWQSVSDLSATMAALTVVSFAALCLQFVFARGINPREYVVTRSALPASLLISAVAGLTAFAIVDSRITSRVGSAMVLALVVFTSVLPSALLAGFLRSGNWECLAVVALSAPIVRLVLWQIDLFEESLLGLLLGVVLAQAASFLIAALLAQNRLSKRASYFEWRQQMIPVFTLGGLICLVGLGSFARQTSLDGDPSDFTNATMAGRSIFFLAGIVAYLSFPGLVAWPLFSRDLAKRFRIGATCVAATTSVLLLLALSSPQFLPGKSGDTDHIEGLVRITSFGWAAMAMSLIPILYYVAHSSRFGLVVFGPVLLMLGAQILSATDTVIAASFSFSACFLMVTLAVPAIARNRSRVQPEISLDVSEENPNEGGVTIIVPSYNSGEVGLKTIHEIRRAFVLQGVDVGIIAVSDGSTDHSPDLFDAVNEPWFRHLRFHENEGKGAALLAGFRLAETACIGFIDADGDIPPQLLPGMVSLLQTKNADIVFGSKWHPNSVLAITRRRRFVSRAHHLLQVLLFDVDIDDTQAGIKIYRGTLLREIMPTLRERKFSLDLEIFVSAHAHGHSRFVEVPIEIRRTGSSSISLIAVIKSFIDMLRIAWRSRISLDYASRAYQSLGSETGTNS